MKHLPQSQAFSWKQAGVKIVTLKMRTPIFKNSLYYLVPNLVSLGNDWSVFTNWLCTGKNHQISLARDSGALPNLFCWSIFSGFVCINSQLEVFTPHPPPLPGVCNLFPPLVSVCSIAGSLELLQTCQLSFVLSSPQAPRVFWSHQCPQCVRQKQVSRAFPGPKSWNIRGTLQLFLFPGRSL